RGPPGEPPARFGRDGRRGVAHCNGAVACVSTSVTVRVHASLFCAAASISVACASSTSTTAALLPGSSRSATACSNSSVIPRSRRRAMNAPMPAPAAAIATGKPMIAPPSRPQAPPYQPPFVVEMSWASRLCTSPSCARTARRAACRPSGPWAAMVEAVTTASHAFFSSSNTATTSTSAMNRMTQRFRVTPRHPVRVTTGHPRPQDGRPVLTQEVTYLFVASSYPFLDVFWTMLIFFLWVIWIWFLIIILTDVFRRRDIGGGKKAVWCIFIIFLPFLGALVYLIANGQGMSERRLQEAQQAQSQMDAYVRSAAGSGGTAGEI